MKRRYEHSTIDQALNLHLQDGVCDRNLFTYGGIILRRMNIKHYWTYAIFWILVKKIIITY